MNQIQIRNVLVVEDDALTRNWLCDLVQTAFHETCVVQAADFESGRSAISTHSLDLALIDLHLGNRSGIELLGHIKRHSPRTFTVVATIFKDDDHVFRALQVGADGYLLKSEPTVRLVQRLHDIMSGEPPLSPEIARRCLAFFSNSHTHHEAELTPRETQVLTLVARGFSRAEIARALEISPHTASDYIKTIYRKLNVSSRAEAAVEAVRLGLLSGC